MDAVERSVLSLVNPRYIGLMWTCDQAQDAVAAASSSEMYLAILQKYLSKPLQIPFAWGKAKRALDSTTTFGQVIKVRGRRLPDARRGPCTRGASSHGWFVHDVGAF